MYFDARPGEEVRYRGVDGEAVEDSLTYGAGVERRTYPFVKVVYELTASTIRIEGQNEARIRVESYKVLTQERFHLRYIRRSRHQSEQRNCSDNYETLSHFYLCLLLIEFGAKTLGSLRHVFVRRGLLLTPYGSLIAARRVGAKSWG